MADGKTHDLFGIGSAIATSIVAASTLPGGSPYFGPYVMGAILGFTHLSPDIDLPQSRPSQRWSLLSFAWHPLRSMTRHRGITHAPFVGSAVMVGYLGMWVMAIAILTGHDVMPWVQDFLFWQGLLAFYVGVTMQQFVHLALDGILIKRLLGGK